MSDPLPVPAHVLSTFFGVDTLPVNHTDDDITRGEVWVLSFSLAYFSDAPTEFLGVYDDRADAAAELWDVLSLDLADHPHAERRARVVNDNQLELHVQGGIYRLARQKHIRRRAPGHDREALDAG